jgi:hypothetical protein
MRDVCAIGVSLWAERHPPKTPFALDGLHAILDRHRHEETAETPGERGPPGCDGMSVWLRLAAA